MSQWNLADADRVSGASMEGDVNGATIRGFQSLELSDECKREPMYGNDSISIGMPRGQILGEFTIETIPEEADEFAKSVGDEFYTQPFTMGISFNRDSGPITINCTRCYFNKNSIKVEAGGQKGTPQTMTGVVLDPIDWNGLAGMRSQDSGGLLDFAIELGF